MRTMSVDPTQDSNRHAAESDVRPFSLAFESTSTHAGWEFPCEGEYSRPHIFWAISLTADSRVNLSTGGATLQDLSGRVSVCARDPVQDSGTGADDERFARGTMDYHDRPSGRLRHVDYSLVL